MKRKSICLFLWLLLIGLSYGGGYLCMTWPLSQSKVVGEPEIIPVTAGKENFILPGTKLILETVNLKTGETRSESGPMPSVYLGLERQELVSLLKNYMTYIKTIKSLYKVVTPTFKANCLKTA